MDVGSGVDHREWDAFSVDHNVALRALFALICRILAGLLAPPGAGTLAESKDALSQSISSALPSRSNKVWCSSSHTPASCHSFRRRQQVIPEPQPISLGNISQGIPLLSTNRMPPRAARSSMRGLPPWGLGGSSGSSGSITSQSSSVTSSLAIFSPYPLPGFVRRTYWPDMVRPYRQVGPCTQQLKRLTLTISLGDCLFRRTPQPVEKPLYAPSDPRSRAQKPRHRSVLALMSSPDYS